MADVEDTRDLQRRTRRQEHLLLVREEGELGDLSALALGQTDDEESAGARLAAELIVGEDVDVGGGVGEPVPSDDAPFLVQPPPELTKLLN